MADLIEPEQQVVVQPSAPHEQRAAQKIDNRVFSRDVTTAMLVPLNKGTAAMFASPSNPRGIELYSYTNVFFCFS